MPEIKNIQIHNNSIAADVGKTGDLFCDEQVSVSPNGKYYFGFGTYYATENSDGIDSIFLFTSDSMVYRKKFEGSALESSFVQDDGTVYFYTDDGDFISLKPDGKQNFKKHVGIYYDDEKCHINSSLSFFYGDSDDGNTSLVLITHADKKLIKRSVSDIEQKDEDGNDTTLYADESILVKTARGFLIMYSDRKSYLMFDMVGNELEATKDELDIAQNVIEEKKRIATEEERKKQESRDRYSRERQELAKMLMQKFGRRKRAAAKFLAKSKGIHITQAKEIVKNIYKEYK